MDDADGGRRGLRARPGPGLRRTLRDHWGLDWSAEAVDLGGSSSLNLLVGDADRRYVVRVHRPHVTPGRLGAIHQARRALLAGGVPCAPPVPTRHGAPWADVEGRLIGRNLAYDRLAFAGGAALIDRFVEVRITSATAFTLLGEAVAAPAPSGVATCP